MLEYTYVKNRDTYYGSYKKDLEDKLKKGLSIINPDIVDTKFYKENYDAVTIFIKPASLASGIPFEMLNNISCALFIIQRSTRTL